MSTTLALHAAAAEALAAMLPSPTALEATPHPRAAGELPPAGTTVIADHLGAVSAEFALVLSADAEDAARQAGGTAAVVQADVLRPALEAASAALGSGVLGEVTAADPATRFPDTQSVDTDVAVFRLAAPGADEPFAWFAVRIKDGAAGRSATVSAHKLARISDVEMALSVVIGRTRMTVSNVLGLEPGDVVDLDRSAGAPADVLLNGRLIAHGEVVVVDQDYAVRITKILDTAETIG
ncbi:flagellar motor switch protein FliN [Specibacter cremeus]|uniref:flagellar motor switch protein FliN n=1 Tax=Specibacter cremeus TaxID=1629051 RepID=UPI000F783E7B|nr:flagellar motor switch protein FliN [Specibacter cremeus]